MMSAVKYFHIYIPSPLPLATLRLSEGKGCLQTLPSVSNEKKRRFLKGRGIMVH